MKTIDFDAARVRIMKAYCQGLFDTYGARRQVPVEREVHQPGPHAWKKDEEWIDPQGIKRRGRFVRLPGKNVKQTVSIPQGVVAEQVVQHAGAIVGAFLETLKIMEESALNQMPPEEVTHIVEGMLKKANGD